MRLVLVILLKPGIQIELGRLQHLIDLLPKRDPIEFIEHGIVGALAARPPTNTSG